jgi:hypothetical protein
MRDERWRDGVLRLRCAQCEGWKSPEDFPRNHRMRYGRSSYCRLCSVARNAQWRDEHRDVINAERRAVYAAGKAGPVRTYSRRAALTRDTHTPP